MSQSSHHFFSKAINTGKQQMLQQERQRGKVLAPQGFTQRQAARGDKERREASRAAQLFMDKLND